MFRLIIFVVERLPALTQLICELNAFTKIPLEIINTHYVKSFERTWSINFIYRV